MKTMKTIPFLNHLADLGIEIRVTDEGGLGVKARKGAMTPEIREALSLRKEEILRVLGRAANVQSTAEGAIPAAPSGAQKPLSFAQERLWFIERMEPGNLVFLMSGGLLVRGAFDVDLFEQCIAAVIARHESLRSAFLERDGKPLLVIADDPDWHLERVDLSDSGGTPGAIEQAAREFAAEFAVRPFDLTQAPLCRVAAVRLAAEEYLLMFSTHHIISDALSRSVFNGEWMSLYNARSRGEAFELPSLPIQYGDFAYWHRGHLSDAVLRSQVEYWRAKLAGLRPVDLATDYRRPARQSYRGSTASFEIGADLTRALKQLAQREGASLYMLLLASFQTLLHRITGQPEITIGTSIGNRDRTEIQGLIGIFVNLLAMRNDFSGNPTFRTLLGRVKETVLDAFSHQDLPFEQVVEACNAPRDLSRHPLFQIQLIYGGAIAGDPALPGLSLEAYDWGAGVVSRLDLTISFADYEGCLYGGLEFNTDLFDPATVQAMVAHFEVLAAAICADPDRPLSAYPIMDEAERACLLVEWNLTTRDYPSERGVHNLFEARVAERPDAVALVFDAQSYTYAQLNAEANRLAHYLIEAGVVRGETVGICLDSGPDVIVAIVAILKAGAAYLPLDADYPQERLAFMLADSGLAVLITQSAKLDALPVMELNFLNTILLDEDRDQIAAAPADNPTLPTAAKPAVGGSDLAYVMYTSGSTGTPKGVAITHRNILRLVCGADYIAFGPEQVLLQAASISFDAATFEIWGSLLHGARLVLMNGATIERLPGLLVETGVTTLWLTSQLFNLMIDDHLESLAGVRQLLAGGDRLSPQHVRRFLDRFPENRLINGYGPTESTTFTCCGDLSAIGLNDFGAPVGPPIANTRVYVVDRYLNPSATGAFGELLIGGDGLARGYWNRPDLTAARFIPNPFAQGEGERVYRTGDWVRWLPAGIIEFGGRIDRQVKLRGYRIELGEIEQNLKSAPGIKDAVVVLGDREGDKRLVAYFVAADGIQADVAELRAYLAAKLPDYMVPAAFVAMEAFPMTANGKIDLAALPAPETVEQEGSGAEALPRTPTEELLAVIWAQILGVQRVGGHDDFFELGGHSLLATQVVSRVREAFGVEMPLRVLFEEPSLADFAHAIDLERGAGRGPAEPPITSAVRRTAGSGKGLVTLPLSFAQERLWFLESFEPGGSTFNIPLGMWLKGDLDEKALRRAQDTLVARHEPLRTRFSPAATLDSAEGALQLIDPPHRADFHLEDLSSLPESERVAECNRRVLEEGARPFSLDQGPLFRTILFRLAPDHHLLFWNMHHIITDAWSLRILFKEFGELYNAYRAGLEPGLPELNLQYGDFADWQRRWLSGAVLEAQLAFWETQLAGIPNATDMPADFPRPPVQTHHGAIESFAFEPEAMAPVRTFCREENATVFMTMLAAFGVLIGRYSNQDDLCLGTPIANRNRAAVEDMLGFFVNMLVLRIDLRPADDGRALTFRQLLARVRRMTLDSYAHQDLPFEKIVDRLQPERDESRPPLFQVVFSQDTILSDEDRDTRVPLADLDIEPLFYEYWISKYDLSLYVGDRGDGMAGDINYNTDLYKPETVRRLIGHYRVLLADLLAHPDRPVREAGLMAPEERERVLRTWNATTFAYPAERGIHELFEEVASQSGAAVALILGEEHWTYAQLNAEANRIAHYLIGQGVAPGDRVALCLESGPHLIAVLLGILKAGGVYVPLDSGHPQERLSFQLGDTGVATVITESSKLDSLPVMDLNFLNTLVLDEDRDLYESESEENPGLAWGGDGLAYILYTSGSTGTPKGVAVCHRSVIRLVRNNPFFQVEADEIFIQAANIAFDATTFEIWGSLLNGARLVLLPNRAIERLPEVLIENRVTIMFLTTQWFQLILDDHPEALAGVRQLLTGGEVMSVAHAARHIERFPENRLIHCYGPTETTTFATTGILNDTGMTPFSAPIGAAIGNTRVYVLDRSLNPVPVGIYGEFYIGGPGLAACYWNRADLTASRFVPHPFPETPGERLYRTGDKVRWTPQGIIEFGGRVDRQVKLRGFRIELGEIEHHLRKAPGVKDAALLIRQRDSDGSDKQLVAYWVATEGSDADSVALRQYLSEHLPDYMVPAAFVALEALPVTANGKVDFRALPAPEERTAESEDGVARPRTQVEELLATIWCNILGVQTIGQEGDFFDLGGHSLLATQVISRVRETFRVDIPLRTLFEHSDLASFARQIEARERAGHGLAEPPMEACPRVPSAQGSGPVSLPLSFAQGRLWFLESFEPGGSTYNIPMGLWLTGDLNVEVLRRCHDELVARHEPLRTRFSPSGSLASAVGPVQLIDPPGNADFSFEDLSLLPEAEREAACTRRFNEEGLRAFDLYQGPLFRTILFRLAPSRHMLFWNMHHIISDAWSLRILLDEMAALYDAFARGEPSPLTELRLQYADFSNWQRQWLRDEVLDRQYEFWDKQLAGIPAATDLPTDFPRPPVQTYPGAIEGFEVSADSAGAINRLAREENATVFMTLLAAFSVLISRYSGQLDFCLGTPIANRNRASVESMVGFFVNMLVLRIDLTRGDRHHAPSFRELLVRIRRMTLDSYAHQDLPFEKIVERLQPVRDESRPPIFQVVFSLETILSDHQRDTGMAFGGLAVDPFAFEYWISKFDLSLYMGAQGDGMAGTFNYNTDLFKRETVQAMAGYFNVLLANLLANPDQPVTDVPMINASEREKVLIDWNRTDVAYPREQGIHQLFEAHAQESGESVALMFGDETWTYARLNGEANRVAHYLVAQGVAPGDPVALCLNPGPGLIATLLGILKAGGAYVPLDSSYPQDRLSFMLADTGVATVITESAKLDFLPAMDLNFLNTLILDEDRDQLEAQPDQDPDLAGGGDNLAYVLYTSGSTGTPKGVANSHRNVVRLVRNNNYIDFGRDQIFLLAASVSFDASTLEIWGSLLNGARLVLMADQSIERLPALLEKFGVSTLWLTSQLFNLMVDDHLESLAGVRQLLAGGDVLSLPHVRRFLDRFESNRLINGYGPTEGTTFTCCADLRVTGLTPLSAPIGTPIANTRVYVLNRGLNPVPVGVFGELMIGGDGLARGYWNQPDLTGARFLPDPFGQGTRLYRTGDKVRWLPSGIIEFGGRVDRQVKLRGYRIELGEIEHHLKSAPGLKDAAFRVVSRARGDKWLVAYIVGKDGATPNLDDLRGYLAEKLPDYMIPNAFVAMEALPLTPNGKLDTRALPHPDEVRSGEDSGFKPPATAAEIALAAIWAEVLGFPQVGCRDDFFELGGHSLLATQVISRMRETLGLEAPLRLIFEHPVLEDCAAQITELLKTVSVAQTPPIGLCPREALGEGLTGAPLSFAQERLWFLDWLEPESAAYNMPLAWRLHGAVDSAAMRQAFQALTDRHEALRTRFSPGGAAAQGAYQIIEAAREVCFEVIDLRELAPDARDSQLIERMATGAIEPFSLQTGPLFRVVLYRLEETVSVLWLNMHHIISDAWSLRIILRDFARFYRAFVKGEEPDLQIPALQYADFAHWQRLWLQGEELERQFAFWRDQLADAPPFIELPLDYPRPAVQSFRGRNTGFEIGAEMAQRLRALSQREGTTLFMTALTAYAVLLARYAGQTDLCIGTPIANRNRSEQEEMVGFFVNMLVLRLDFSKAGERANPSFRQLLASTKRVTLDAFAHQDLPFEKIVERFQPVRDASRPPLFQVVFAQENILSGRGNAQSELGEGLVATAQDFEYEFAKFDLSLHIAERGDEIVCAFNFNLDLFSEETIARMVGHFQQLLEGLVANPDGSVFEVPIIDADERATLLHTWNDTAVPFPRDLSVAELFEAQVRRAPDAVALIFEAGTWTYARLDREANRMARDLAGRGVQPGDLVGICLPTGPYLIASLLAILKTGAAYLPLDGEYPRERLAFMVADSGVRHLVTSSARRELLPIADDALTCTLLDEKGTDREAPLDKDPGFTTRSLGGDGLAYVMYTSGSTGIPKGVAVRHRNILRLVIGADYMDFGPNHTILQVSSVSFDASTLEIWGSLLHGARLVLVPADQIDRVPQIIVTHGLTTLWLTTQFFNLMVDDHLESMAGLSQVLTGGEALSMRHARRFLDRYPDIRLINGYGPTESTTFTACGDMGRIGLTALSGPIGGPIANTRTHILDQRFGLVPAGVFGELFIAGDGLAQGYWNRPDLTAERFVPNPIDEIAGDRLYRTGDKVRWLSGGVLEFGGRVDRQIKLRGFRIEPGEIEHKLGQVPGVKNAALILSARDGGEKRLIAYLVGEHGVAPEIKAVRQFLADSLPEYMIPQSFVVLDQLPVTANGKLDTRALPDPDLAGLGHGAPLELPQSPAEEMIASIWAEILNIERVGRDQDFFQSGGHSLLATRAVSRLRDSFTIDLPLRAIFENATPAAMARRIEVSLRAGAGAGDMPEPPLRPAPTRRAGEESEFPLSFAQERLWFLDSFEPGSVSYNLPVAYRLTGQLDEKALRRTFDLLVQRHDSLRTRFSRADELGSGQDPRQFVDPSAAAPFNVEDFSGLPESARLDACQEAMAREVARPFSLERGQLFRVTLFRLGADRYVVLMNMHHIISDGWSLKILFHEAAQIYTALRRGQAPSLAPLALQYGDYAVWQRDWLRGQVLERQLGFWESQLSGAPAFIDWPTDFVRPADQTFSGANHAFEIEPRTAARLAELGRGQAATPFMVYLAAYALFLARISRQDDVCIGTPIANRNRSAVEPIVGFFVNTLVMRVRLSAGETGRKPSFIELLGLVRQTALEAYAHQDLPFEQIVERLKPERDTGRSPLFQTLFSIETLGLLETASQVDLPDLVMTPEEYDYPVAKFEISLNLAAAGDRLMAVFNYNTDLFKPQTMARFADSFSNLLSSLAAAPHASVDAASLMDQNDVLLMIRDWSGTRADYPRELTLGAAFEQQVARDPDAIALVDGDREITYAELNAAVNRVAHAMLARGVRPGTRVGICMERSAGMITALLAIVKIGAAYVPIDTAFPVERVRLMVEDAELVLLVTRTGLEAGETSGAELLFIDDETALREFATENPGISADPGFPVYVIYTSGTTGRPKGVVVSHRGVMRLVLSPNVVQISRDDVFLQITSISFDVSTFEIWGSLLNGARLVLMPHDAVELLPEMLKRHDISILWLTSQLFQLVIDEHLHALGGVKQLLAGGDAVPLAQARRFMATYPHNRLINGYGPTENTTFTTYCDLTATGVTPFSAPIGKGVTNSTVYVLDARIDPVPVGIAGELYTGGEGLAIGYLKRPELTATRFVPNPFAGLCAGDSPGQRLYATGDLVRFLTDGRIEFLGRVDQQVKVRGFRVELGEIEFRLAGHPAVGSAVVRPVTVGSDKRLAAYVVPLAGTSSQAIPTGAAADDLRESMRRFLAETLPGYMIPAAFVLLEELPRNRSGKLNSAALPNPFLEMGEESGEFVTPRTPTEEVLAGIWSQILDIERVGADRNFFDLGGHSLLATRAVSRMQEACGVRIELKSLFRFPVLREFAEHLDELKRGDHGLAEPPLAAVPRAADGSGVLPLSFAQERLWFLDRLEPGSAAYNMPIAFEISAPLDLGLFGRCLDALAERHESLRTRFDFVDGRPVQVIDAPGPVDLTLVDLTGKDPAAREPEAYEQLALEAHSPFSLEEGPLFRALICKLESEKFLCLLNMHHIISDGWSLTVLLRELSALYGAFVAGRSTPLAAPAIQYGDFSVWQRDYLSGAVLERQLNYWAASLQGAPEHIDLATDRPRPPVQTFNGAFFGFALPPETVRAVRDLSRRAGATPFMTLLAAIGALLSRYSGQDNVLIGTAIANRRRESLESLIGFFVNTLVMRVDCSGTPAFTNLVERVRRMALDAYAHQDVPFEQVVERVRPQRDTSRPPLCQVMFLLETLGMAEVADAAESAGLAIALRDFEYRVAKFDLTLSLTESAEGYQGSINYNTDLFDRETIARLAHHFEILLHALIAEPERVVTAPSLIGEDERIEIAAWNDTGMAFPDHTTLHQMFEDRVQESPDAVAVCQGERELDFGALNAAANRIAHYLLARGTGRDEAVGVRMGQSFETIAALLGVLKAGGCYLAIDPAYPAERVAHMIAGSGTRILITEPGLPPFDLEVAETLVLEPGLAAFEAYPHTNPGIDVDPAQRALVLFTSGTTGRPKGVQLTHRNVVGMVSDETQYRFERGDGMAQLSNFSFDMFTQEVWTSLTRGGRLCLIGRETLLDREAFAQALRRHRVDIAIMTTALFNQYVHGRPDLFAGLKAVTFGGEKAEPAAVRAVLAANPPGRLINGYGPAEGTSYVTAHLIEAMEPGVASVPIGKPAGNTAIHLLDEQMNQVPVGVAGEIYIGGAGLARGYLGQSTATAAVFVPDPFAAADEYGGRLYRTGDLARYRRDPAKGGAVIEFLGRRDHQVKIRGFRIELGEIETVLAEHPDIAEVAVLARPNQAGELALVAYVIAQGGDAARTPAGDGREFREGVRDWLAMRLPAYLVPGYFALLDRLPLTANRKLDVAALPAIKDLEPAGERTFVAPDSGPERQIAAIWREVLGIEQVGTRDNFFDLGGHSLALARVHEKLCATFGINLPLLKLYEFTTIGGLAAYLETAEQGDLVTAQVRDRIQARKDAMNRGRRRRAAPE